MSRRLVICEPLESRRLLQGYTPTQIETAYGFNQISFNNGAVAGSGAGQTIALIETYNDMSLTSDLQSFDAAFGLSNPGASWSLNIVGEGGGAPPLAGSVGSATLETALDVEWAHALAPAANILVVEASSGEDADLDAAINYAAGAPGVSVVSTSYVRSEVAGDRSLDVNFQTPAKHNGVTFVAAAGDSGTVTHPAASPNVLGVGGTTLTLNTDNTYAGETVWNNEYGQTGGGTSRLELEPAYQLAVQSSGHRMTPDVAFDADPMTGFLIYSGGIEGVVGGTSAGAPAWAALLAIADQGRALNHLGTLDGPSQTLPMLYDLVGTPLYNQAFHDITMGSNGVQNAGPDYDETTGLGSPQANVLAQYLAGNIEVPEPATIAMALLGTTLILRRPRREQRLSEAK